LGSSLGIDLWTKAFVRLTEEAGVIEGRIIGETEESDVLISKTVIHVLKHLKLDKEYGAFVETESNIPIARGLKSSSAAANAITLAILSALKKKIDDLTAINLGVDAAMDAKVSITGAFDDACASYFGNVVVTDNYSRKILKRFVPKDYVVILHVPHKRIYTAASDVEKIQMVAREVEATHREAFLGNYWTAMNLNGMIYSAVLGYDAKIAIDALSAGAIAASISGTGPAVAAVISDENKDRVKRVWKHLDGSLIETRINRTKAHILT
jgi:shikimate kinase